MSRPLRLAVAEPSAILRKGIVAVLERMHAPAVEVLEVDDLLQLGARLRRHRPDLVIVNPASPGVPPPHRLREEAGSDGMRCVALQVTVLDEAVTRAYDAVISLCDSPEAIRTRIASLAGATARPDTRQELSPREREIVVCIVKGLTNKRIADMLCISTHTVITHRRNIAAKLQIHSAAGLTIYAIVNKLVELAEIESSINEI